MTAADGSMGRIFSAATATGAKDAKAGAAGSVLNLNSYPLNHRFDVTFGVLEKECRGVLTEFFKARRKK